MGEHTNTVEDNQARTLGYRDFEDWSTTALADSGRRRLAEYDRITGERQALSRHQHRLMVLLGYRNPPESVVAELDEMGYLTGGGALTAAATREWLDACDILDTP